MTRYIEFSLDEGGSILIESPDEAEKSSAGFSRSGSGAREVAEQARQSLDASLENVRKSADLLVRKLRALGDPPDEMEVTFSLKASGEMGNIAVGRAGAEANYTVVLRWKKDEAPKAAAAPAPAAEA